MARLFLINQFANIPSSEGHTRQYEIASYLVRKGWQVDIFASDFNLNKRKYSKLKLFQLSNSERISGIKWNWIWASPYKQNNWLRYLNIFTFFVHLSIRLFLIIFFKTIQRKKPDIILASSPQLPAAFATLIISKIFFIPFVLEIRDLWPQILIDEGVATENSLIIKFLRFLENTLYKHSNEIIILSKGVKEYIFKRSGRKSIWLPNGSDLRKFQQKALLEEPKYFTLKKPFKVLYAGAHGRSNALDKVLDAAKILKDEPIHFIFIGDGPTKRILVNNSKHMKNVEFKSSLPKEKMPEIFENSDAVLVTLKDNKLFKYGVSPNKLYDAYAIGRPIIASVGGEINKEVEENKIGFACEPENPDALAKIIRKLSLCSRNERQDMANRARSLAESTYSRQKINPKINYLLKKIINK